MTTIGSKYHASSNAFQLTHHKLFNESLEQKKHQFCLFGSPVFTQNFEENAQFFFVQNAQKSLKTPLLARLCIFKKNFVAHKIISERDL